MMNDTYFVPLEGFIFPSPRRAPVSMHLLFIHIDQLEEKQVIIIIIDEGNCN